MRDSAFKYASLGWQGGEEEKGISPSIRKHAKNHWKDAALVLLAGSTAVLFLLLFGRHANDTSQSSHFIGTGPDSWKQFTWWSKYSTKDHDKQAGVDQMWENIRPSHGVVAVDHQWATKQGLPDSISLPSDTSKGVYIIDAYHQIHCLRILRKTFYQISRNEPVTYPLDHSMHCFDNLRQYIMCTAGDTLLYTWAHNTTGDGQLRKCRNWSALSDWATQNSACYRDSETPIELSEHMGHCDDGTDGIILD